MTELLPSFIAKCSYSAIGTLGMAVRWHWVCSNMFQSSRALFESTLDHARPMLCRQGIKGTRKIPRIHCRIYHQFLHFPHSVAFSESSQWMEALREVEGGPGHLTTRMISAKATSKKLGFLGKSWEHIQWIGFRENLREGSMFDGKNM